MGVTSFTTETLILFLRFALLIALYLFLWQVIEDFRHGSPSWFLTFFLTPFALIGVGLLGMVLHQFLALFNPRPTLELSSDTIPPGGAAELRWSFTGRTSRIRELVVTLRGLERAVVVPLVRAGQGGVGRMVAVVVDSVAAQLRRARENGRV